MLRERYDGFECFKHTKLLYLYFGDLAIANYFSCSALGTPGTVMQFHEFRIASVGDILLSEMCNFQPYFFYLDSRISPRIVGASCISRCRTLRHDN